MLKNYPIFIQESKNDCGLCSLLMIFKYHGINISKNKLQKMVKLSKQGITALNLINASNKLGLNAKGVTCDIKSLNNQYLPLIAHTVLDNNYLHYLVIYKIDFKNNFVLIGDPGEGLKKITIDEFNKISSKVFIIFEKNNLKKEKDKRFKNFIKKIIINNKKMVIKTIFISIIVIVLSLIFSLFLKLIIENINNNQYLIIIFISFLLISIFKNILNYFKNKMIGNLSLNIDRNINNDTYKHIFLLPYQYLTNKSNGEIFSIVSDLSDFKESIINLLMTTIIDVLMIIGILLFMIFINPILIILIFIIILIYYFIFKYYSESLYQIFFKLKKANIETSIYLLESLSAVETIKNLNIHESITKKLYSKYESYSEHIKKYNEKYNEYNFNKNIINETIFIMIVLTLVFLISKNIINIYDLILFESIFYILNGCLEDILNNGIVYKNYLVGINKILDLYDIKEENLNSKSYELINEIDIKNLSFSYDNNKIFNNANLNISKGDKILLTGPSGSGKSTIIKLLLKYIKGYQGIINLNDKNIKNINPYIIRDNITYVSQNEKLYSDTVENNIILGERYINNLNDVCNVSLVDQFLKEKNITYQEYLEEQGINLSGGEKKRLVIARSLLKNSNIIVFDESFNEMDAKMEREILSNIFKRYNNKTIIVITHRLVNKDLFDKYFIIENKKIIKGG